MIRKILGHIGRYGENIVKYGMIITIMTTNHKNKLDESLIRPGRIDSIFEFK